MVDWPEPRTLGVLLFPGFDLLDVTGPLHAFGMLKNVFEQELIAETPGPVESAQGPQLVAEHAREGAPKLDLLLVPGGIGSRKQVQDQALLAWLAKRAADAEIVMSVSSGAALLAAAGVLDGHRATTNARGADWVAQQGPRATWVRKARWLDDGRVITSAGVASGLDMALHVITRLTEPDVGANVARSLEYDWNPDATEDAFGGAGAGSS